MPSNKFYFIMTIEMLAFVNRTLEWSSGLGLQVVKCPVRVKESCSSVHMTVHRLWQLSMAHIKVCVPTGQVCLGPSLTLS